MSQMMEYKGYHAKIMFDAEDNILTGMVYGIADSLNFHGSSISEAEEIFHQSIDNYLAMCGQTGKKPERERGGFFPTRISQEPHNRIRRRTR